MMQLGALPTNSFRTYHGLHGFSDYTDVLARARVNCAGRIADLRVIRQSV